MFLGSYTCPINQTAQIQIPELYRLSLSGDAYVTQGFDKNLLVWSGEAFREMIRQLTSLNVADPLVRLLIRMLIGTAAELTVDEAGQALLPDELCQYANLNQKAVLVGHGLYFEIWSAAQWDSQKSELQNAEANSSRFASLTLFLN